MSAGGDAVYRERAGVGLATEGRGGVPRTAVRTVVSMIDTHQVSGPGRQLAALALALRAHAVELVVVMFRRRGRPHPPYAEYLQARGIRVSVLEDFGPADLSLPGRLRRELDRLRPDVVQTHNYRLTALAFLLRRTGARWPWVAFFHGATAENVKVRLYNLVDAALLPRADRLVVMSQGHRVRFASGRAASRVRVIYNAVLPTPEPAAKAELPAGLAGWRDRPLLGIVGRLSHEKGVDVFLDAAARLAGSGVRFHAVIAGSGPEERALRARCTRLGLDDRVRFLGAVSNVEALYPLLDLLVIPSRSEGLPNVLLESVRAGVPAVATRVGAVPEVLEGSAAGRLVAPGSAEELASAIAASLEVKRRPGTREACEEVARRFSLEQRVEAHLALYDELLADR